MSDDGPKLEGARRLRFGEFELDLRSHELRRAGSPGSLIGLEPKVFDLLALLAGRAGELVTREEILACVWPGVHVTGWVIDRAVRQLRMALDDDGRRQRVLQTVRGRGFRFAVPVEPIEAATEPPRLPESGPLRRALEAAAVTGGEFTADPLAYTLDAPRPGVEESLRAACRAGWLREDAVSHGRFAFADPALEERLRAGVAEGHRARWLLRLADWEEARDPSTPPVSRLLEAYRAGADCGQALARYALRGAREQELRGARDAADAQLERVEQALADRGVAADVAMRWRLALARGRLRVHAGAPEEGLEVVARVVEVARRVADAELLAEAAALRDEAEIFLGGVRLFSAETPVLLDEAWERLTGAAPAVRAPVRAAQARRLFYAGRRAEAQEVAAEALALAEAAGDGRLRADALVSLYWACWEPQRRAERARLAAELTDEALALGDTALRYRGQLLGAISRGEACDLDGLHAALRELEHLRRSAPAGVPPSEAWIESSLRRMQLLARGSLAEAEAEILAALAQPGPDPRADARALLAAQLHQLRSFQGRIAEVLPAVEDLPRRLGRPWGALLAAAYAELGRHADARQEIAALSREDLDVLHQSVNVPFLLANLAVACRLAGVAEPAGPLYERLRPLAGHPLTLRPATLSLGWADRYLGLLAWAAGRTKRAEEHLLEAQRHQRAAGLRPWVALTALDLAALLGEVDEDGASPRAEAALSEAEALARTLGMHGVLRETERQHAAATGGR